MRKYIVGFIVGAIIFGTIGVYAAGQMFANQVKYTRNGTEITVDLAIDDLYTKLNASKETGMWMAYSGIIGESMIRLENGTVINKLTDNTANGLVGNKIRIVETANASSIELYAVQSGKFRVTYGNISGTSNSEEIETEAGQLIASYPSLTYGFIEALF